MDTQGDSLIKQREISFCTLHPDRAQAHTASSFLVDVPGIMNASAPTDALLQVEYRLLEITLFEIEQLLEERGFHLDNRLFQKLRRALFYYTEDTQRANMGCGRGESNCTAKVFASNYKRRNHGCKDDRPAHWRRYL